MADQPPLQWSPPLQIASGDSLVFQINLPLYKPSDGWSIVLVVTAENGQQAAKVVSVPDATNTYHTFNVQNFLGGQLPGNYVLSEQLECAANGVAPNASHQIYYSPLKVLPNLALGGAPGPIETQAQRMLHKLHETYERLIERELQETDIQRSRAVVKRQGEVLLDIKYWKEVRRVEIQREMALNGKDPGVTIRPILTIGF